MDRFAEHGGCWQGRNEDAHRILLPASLGVHDMDTQLTGTDRAIVTFPLLASIHTGQGLCDIPAVKYC